MRSQAVSGFTKIKQGITKNFTDVATPSETSFKAAGDNVKTSFKKLSEAVEKNLSEGKTKVHDAIWSAENQTKLKGDINKHANEAAAKVQPRWKSVLKWVITIVVIIAVIAITILSAGSLGPVGLVLLGATLGALSGAAIKIGHNMVVANFDSGS